MTTRRRWCAGVDVQLPMRQYLHVGAKLLDEADLCDYVTATAVFHLRTMGGFGLVSGMLHKLHLQIGDHSVRVTADRERDALGKFAFYEL